MDVFWNSWWSVTNMYSVWDLTSLTQKNMLQVLSSHTHGMQSGRKCDDMSSRPAAKMAAAIFLLCSFTSGYSRSVLKSPATIKVDPWGH